MGILDEAKDKLGDAAEWVKDKASTISEQAPGAAQSLGEKAADAKHWVQSTLGREAHEGAEHAPDGERESGGGSFAKEWVEDTAQDAAARVEGTAHVVDETLSEHADRRDADGAQH